MCQAHWRRVPIHQQANVWDSQWPREAYDKAVQKAVDAITTPKEQTT